MFFNVQLAGADLTEVFRAEGRSMEEEMREEGMEVVQTEQADGVKNEGELSKSSPPKRGRGRPQGSKKLKVCVTDINLAEQDPGISNGESIQPRRGRGRPKRLSSKEAVQAGSRNKGKGRSRGSKKEASSGGSPTSDLTPRKRGRPKSYSQSIAHKVAAEDLSNGGSSSPKVGRGRPKGSTKRKRVGAEDATPKKRGRPKKRRLEAVVSSEEEAETDGSSPTKDKNVPNGISPQKRRGRPRKSLDNKKRNKKLLTDGSEPVKRGRGRPKGSATMKRPAYKKAQYGTVKRPQKVQVSTPKERVGRPKKTAKRGRPRKYPLALSEDRKKKPKVWKPLGRPRKYPRPELPEGALAGTSRKPGRPCKSASKRGAHLRKKGPSTPSSARNVSDGSPKKRGRPPSNAKSAQKRGRPKGSSGKNKGETQLDSTLSNHSEENSDAAILLEGGPVEEDVEDNVENNVENNVEANTEEDKEEDKEDKEEDKEDGMETPAADAEETVIEQDATFEVSNQA